MLCLWIVQIWLCAGTRVQLECQEQSIAWLRGKLFLCHERGWCLLQWTRDTVDIMLLVCNVYFETHLLEDQQRSRLWLLTLCCHHAVSYIHKVAAWWGDVMVRTLGTWSGGHWFTSELLYFYVTTLGMLFTHTHTHTCTSVTEQYIVILVKSDDDKIFIEMQLSWYNAYNQRSVTWLIA